MKPLAISPAWKLPSRPMACHWLVEGLWARQAVGIIGGEPKCFKTFLALDLAVAVASGAPCLGHFPTRSTGRVLVYAAEDALHDVRRRLEGICAASGLALSEQDLHVITEPNLRLDIPLDRRRLEAAVAEFEPRLLVLDPFVRLHRVDENVSAQIVPLLAYLKDLQREHGPAVAVVHHARKGAGRARPGQALRGSSEFHGWGASNLYLRRVAAGGLLLDSEHRAAPSIDGIRLALTETGPGLALRVVPAEDIPAEPAPPAASPRDRILRVLREHHGPHTFGALRNAVRMRTATFAKTLARLVADGEVARSNAGYRLP